MIVLQLNNQNRNKITDILNNIREQHPKVRIILAESFPDNYRHIQEMQIDHCNKYPISRDRIDIIFNVTTKEQIEEAVNKQYSDRGTIRFDYWQDEEVSLALQPMVKKKAVEVAKMDNAELESKTSN